MIVVVLEVAFDHEEAGLIPSDIARILESAREQAAARMVGSYEMEGKYGDSTPAMKEWMNRGISTITINQPVTLDIRDW